MGLPAILRLTRRTLATALSFTPFMSVVVRAQIVAPPALQVSRPDTMARGLPGSTITMAFRLRNVGRDSLALTPRIELPAGWMVLVGNTPLALAPGESDSWLTSVRIPARAEAGPYMPRVTLVTADGRTAASDSFRVRVLVKRALQLVLAEHPTYAVTGSAYRSVFLLRNRGNVTTKVSLRALSSLGAVVHLEHPSVTLHPDETRHLVATVAPSLSGYEAVDDVVELYAADGADTTINASASSRVTIVQRANVAEPFHTVASTLRLRAADASAGVSRFELSGSGRLRDDGSETVDYLLRGPTSRASAFGEREEYRIALRGRNFTARAGDAFYALSALTSGGRQGVGGALEIGSGPFIAGGYVERSRLQGDALSEQEAPAERAGYLRAAVGQLSGAPEITIGALDRTGGVFAGRVLSSALTLAPLPGTRLSMEYAISNGADGRGTARTVHLDGGTAVHFDLVHTLGSDRFAGAIRANEHDYASVSAKVAPELLLSAATGLTRAGSSVVGEQLLELPQRYRTSSLELAYASRVAVRYSALDRSSTFIGTPRDEWQRGIGVNADQTFGWLQLRGSADRGVARSMFDDSTHPYTELSVGATSHLGQHALMLYGESSDGAVITRGSQRVVTVGGDFQSQFSTGTVLSAGASETRVATTGDRYAQIDARAAQTLPTGATVSARVRIAGYDARQLGQRPLAYLEYSMPVGVPVGRAHTEGRVRGRILSRETGRGVAGALVRLGPQTAITDDDGRIAFAGLPAGQYRVAVSEQTVVTQSVFAGDPRVQVDSGRRAPTMFSLAIERGGAVEGAIRLTAVARTGLAGAPDSLRDAGPAGGITIALQGTRDTLFRLSAADGTFRFTDVPSGEWFVRPMDDAPAGLRWESPAQSIVVRSGEQAVIRVRLVPRRRVVRPLDGSPPLELRDSSPYSRESRAEVARAGREGVSPRD